MTIDDVYVNIDNISSVKYNFKQIEGFDSVFKNMMRYLHKYLSLVIEHWTKNEIFPTWLECYIGTDKYHQSTLSKFIKSSINQTNYYDSSYLVPFDEVGGWRIIICESEEIYCHMIYFVNADTGRTIEVNFRRMSEPLVTDSLKKLKDII